MKIVIAPDKFKGSLGAAQVASALSRGFLRAWPDAEMMIKPIADGGEGFAKALAQRTTEARVLDALGREVTAEYGWMDDRSAVIEMSAASGSWRIAGAERDPLHSSTTGTGGLIVDAMAHGADVILLGIGGSATNDGGAGMAHALGYHFLDRNGASLVPVPANLCRLVSIHPPVQRPFPRMIAACDVNNPLLGVRGATRVYGPQKGAAAAELEILENALEHLADVVTQDFGCDFRAVPGAGAAGGLGFGLMSFCGAEIRSGFELVAEYMRLEEAIAASDLVITGEGKIDAQTFNGKGPAGVAALARKHGKPVLAFAGMHESCDSQESAGVFEAVIIIAPPGTANEESIRNAAAFLESAATTAANQIRSGALLL